MDGIGREIGTFIVMANEAIDFDLWLKTVVTPGHREELNVAIAEKAISSSFPSRS